MTHVLLAALALVALAPAAEAAVFRAGPEVSLRAGEVIGDDLYVAGGHVTLDGRVRGDLIVAGGTVTVNGPVDGDVIAAGGTLRFAAPVGESLRAAGGELRLTSRVGGDLIAAASEIETTPAATVAGDAVLRAGELMLAGGLGRTLVVSGASVRLLGNVAGPATLSAPLIAVGDSARVAGPLRLETATLRPLAPGARTGPVSVSNPFARENALGSFLRWLVMAAMAFVFGLAALVFFPAGMARLATTTWRRPPLRVLVGLGLLFAVPLAAILAMVTVVGLPLGLLALLAFGAALYGASIVVGWSIGRVAVERLFGLDASWKRILALAGGVALVQTLQAVPLFGPYFTFVLALWGLGGIGALAYSRLRPGAPA